MIEQQLEIKRQINNQLRAYSKRHNLDHNFTLMRYAGQRLLYRMSISRYSDLFVLKGAMLFSLWTSKLLRPTKDIDLMGYGKDSQEDLRQIFYEIASMQITQYDGIEFDIEKISVESIRQNQTYQGKHIKIPVKDSSIVVQIDIGFGDLITPKACQAVYPSLIIDLPETKIKVYNKETVIAEKFEAIVSLGTANSRMKDFYDILVLSEEFDFSGEILSEAIQNTFSRRRTALPDGIPEGLNKSLMLTTDKKTMWNNFISRSSINSSLEFYEVIERLCVFLLEPVKNLNSGHKFDKNWVRSGLWK